MNWDKAVWEAWHWRTSNPPEWALIGVFKTPEEASNACKTLRSFYFPIEMGVVYPENKITDVDPIYPRANDSP